MSNPTKTALARDLRDMLVREGLVSIYFEGLMGDVVWISSNRRAYRLTDLGDAHISNIYHKYLRNKEEIPRFIKIEYDRRIELRQASKP